MNNPDQTEVLAARQHWMAILARLPAGDLDELLQTSGDGHEFNLLRPAECGLCMVRGRISARGDAFNLGEVSITRCVVQLDNTITGVAYIKGRDKKRAEMAARLDALLQSGSLKVDSLQEYSAKLDNERKQRTATVATTKVDFFTMARDR